MPPKNGSLKKKRSSQDLDGRQKDGAKASAKRQKLAVRGYPVGKKKVAAAQEKPAGKRAREADAVKRVLKPAKRNLKGKEGDEKSPDRRQQLKAAKEKWEKLRRRDTPPDERAALVANVIEQVEGRVAHTATSPTGSRVLQTCVKHGTPEQRAKLLQQIQPQLLDMSKSPYGHFLICKLIAKATKDELAGIFSAFKGHVPALLRHPCGAAVINELFNVASTAQRNHLAAEFYGKEYTLLSQEAAPSHLYELLETVDPPKRRAILQRMAMHLTPIMEKALVDPVLSHRLIAEYLQSSAPAARQEAMESLAGEPLLRMVHTRDGAWAASAVFCNGTAKDCKKTIKAMKGHIETMAKDRWGSLALISALSNVDDTALMRKSIVRPLQESLKVLVQDKHARHIFLQLLAPDKVRYLQPELLCVVHPTFDAAALVSSNAALPSDTAAKKPAEEEQSKPAGQGKKEGRSRRTELLGEGSKSLGARLLATVTESLEEFLKSATGYDVVVEMALGGSDGVMMDNFHTEVEILQKGISDLVRDSSDNESIVENLYGSRALRRLVLASQEAEYQTETSTSLAKTLWSSIKNKQLPVDSHGKKVLEAFKKCNFK